MGARPRWFLAAVLLPPGTPKRSLAGVFDEIDKACAALGICLCGGHTEATSAVARPVVVGTMVGTVSEKRLVRPGRARPGDSILLTKRLALEGTSIIARERKRDILNLLGRRGAYRARGFLFHPGISVVREALVAVKTARVHAMHDPTEGGLIWGLKELSIVTGIGVEVDTENIPVYEETRAICEHYGFDPLGLIASGSLLIVVSRRSAPRVCRAIREQGIECTEIGRLRGRRSVLLKDGKAVALPRLKADEITRIPPPPQSTRGQSSKIESPAIYPGSELKN
jgi:hydrogenase maturation factor